MVNLLKARKAKKQKKPNFYRQEWFRMGNQRKKWRKWRTPRGNQSKLRMHKASRGAWVQAGYGSPAAVRGMHPSGLRELIVHNVQQLSAATKDFAVRIAHGVGGKKRAEIMKIAEGMKLKVLNPFIQPFLSERKGMLPKETIDEKKAEKKSDDKIQIKVLEKEKNEIKKETKLEAKK